MKILEKIGLTTAAPESSQAALEKAIEHEANCRVDEENFHRKFIASKQADDALEVMPNTDGMDAATARKVERDHAKRKDAARAKRIEDEATWQRQIEIRKQASKAVAQAQLVLDHADDATDGAEILDYWNKANEAAQRLLARAARNHRGANHELLAPIAIVHAPNGLQDNFGRALQMHLEHVPNAPKPKRAPLAKGMIRLRFLPDASAVKIRPYNHHDTPSMPEDQAWAYIREGVAEVVENSLDGTAKVAAKPIAPSTGAGDTVKVKILQHTPGLSYQIDDRVTLPPGVAKNMIDAGICEIVDAPAPAEAPN